MLLINQLSMSYGNKLLFYDVNLTLNADRCYALVGANGAGKSTFFNLLNGVEDPVSGTIQFPKDATFGWLKQDQFRYEHMPVREVVMIGKHALWQAFNESEQLYAETDWTESVGFRVAELEQIIADNGGYTANAEIEEILQGLGIAKESIDQPLSALSGGYKLRVLLAQVLFQSPSVLLLDEPTNHLDIESIRWLESFLKKQFKGLVVFISHDLDFINNAADVILDLDYGEIRSYPGHYKKFLFEKKLLEEQRSLEIKNTEAKIAQLQKFVDRNKAKASKAGQARSRMKMIEKIEIPDVKKSSRVAPFFYFEMGRASSKIVLQVNKLSKHYDDKKLFTDLSFNLIKGEKLAIMGVNGIGKSTLLKTALGLVQPDNGHTQCGGEVTISYFSQDHHDSLKTSMPVLSWLREQVKSQNEQAMRRALGRVLFTKDDVDKDVLTLSGGEAARLLLAKVMLDEPNVIVLDEPTNHMDLETIESLCQALADYEGTLIFVSHNRHFVNKIATKILYFESHDSIQLHQGNYLDFETRCL